MHKARVGSIITGTLRTQDLLRAFADELEWLAGAPQISASHGSCLIADAREWADRLDDTETCSPSDEQDAQEILCDIYVRLDELAPPYCYLGKLDGDGSDFGFWPSMVAIEELPRVENGDEARELGEDAVYVNDHGNVTVFGADGSVLLEVV